MRKTAKRIALISAVVSFSVAGGTSILAQSTYVVTIQNLTRNQIITPPVVVIHNSSTSLFSIGEEASPELSALAEDGDPVPLLETLMTMPGVHDSAVGYGIIPPSQSTTATVTSSYRYRFLSVVGKLATTNDSFFAVGGVQIPLPPTLFFSPPRSKTVDAPAYDAGSEANSELCEFIPGPPCASHFVHDPAEAEGFIHIGNGIQGIGDINAAESDWRNPVVRVTITRVD